jgi:hypothetical protein
MESNDALLNLTNIDIFAYFEKKNQKYKESSKTVDKKLSSGVPKSKKWRGARRFFDKFLKSLLQTSTKKSKIFGDWGVLPPHPPLGIPLKLRVFYN